MFELFDATEQANRTALILVQERYTNRFASFVKSSKTRLIYVAQDLDQLIVEAAQETGADETYVRTRFEQYLADAVLDNNPPREDLSYKNGDEGFPPAKYQKDDPLGEEVKDADVQDQGAVEGAGLEEALEPDARVDLGDSSSDGGDGEVKTEPIGTRSNYFRDATTKQSCFRCETELDARERAGSPVCAHCAAELAKLADGGYFNDQSDSTFQNTSQEPITEEVTTPQFDLPYRCKICGKEETLQDIQAHVRTDHADVLQRAEQQAQQFQEVPGQQEQDMAMSASTKKADVPESDQDPEKTRVEPLPTSPADHFDDMVQDLADRGAAEQLSMPTDEEIHSIASQLGVPTEEVQNSIITTALIGKYQGQNGRLADTIDAPDGYQEVGVDGQGGRVEGREALVGVDAVVNKVADSMNMEPGLVYQQVKDRYGGAEMPDKYHASISGERHFYLPAQLAGQAQQQQAPQQQPVDPNVGPAAPPAPEPQQQQQF